VLENYVEDLVLYSPHPEFSVLELLAPEFGIDTHYYLVVIRGPYPHCRTFTRQFAVNAQEKVSKERVLENQVDASTGYLVL
ncbi:uncharacterized protein METZ01_LOCUS401311, partial [marine metagenome]